MPDLDQSQRDLVGVLARAGITQVAPEELPTFRRSVEVYLADPGRLTRGSKDEPLGFGIGEAVVLITPIALTIASQVASYLAHATGERVAATVVDSALKRFANRFRRRRAAPASTSPTYTSEQVAQVRDIALRTGLARGLSHERATSLAMAMAAALPKAD